MSREIQTAPAEEIARLRRDAALGSADAQYWLAMRHIYGQGVPEDNVLAFSLLEKAAAQDHIEAAYALAICFHYGHGTAVSLETAFRLYIRCAQAGHGKGMEVTGRFYNRGIAVPRDREKAEYWLGKALESGDPDAVEEAERELRYGAAQQNGQAPAKKAGPLNN